MKPYHILVVEDEAVLQDYYKIELESRGYQVTVAGTIKQAAQALTAARPALILLDIMMPDGSGLEWCHKIREEFGGPVIFQTNLGESEQIIRGLRLGGDDYMIKPCPINELAARIEAHLRKVARFAQELHVLCGGKLTIDTHARKICLNNEELILKPKEYQLLYLLIKYRGEYLTAEELYLQAWDMEPNNDIRTIWVHISTLRRKLRTDKDSSFVDIRFEKTKGYFLVIDDAE